LFPAERAKVRKAMENMLQKAALKILMNVNRDKEHIPPITTSDSNPFPYRIILNPRTDSWGNRISLYWERVRCFSHFQPPPLPRAPFITESGGFMSHFKIHSRRNEYPSIRHYQHYRHAEKSFIVQMIKWTENITFHLHLYCRRIDLHIFLQRRMERVDNPRTYS